MPLGSHLGGEAKSFKVRIKNWEYVSVWKAFDFFLH